MNNEVINRENKNIYTNTKTLKDVSQYQEILKYMSLPKTLQKIYSQQDTERTILSKLLKYLSSKLKEEK